MWFHKEGMHQFKFRRVNIELKNKFDTLHAFHYNDEHESVAVFACYFFSSNKRPNSQFDYG